jgi:hypothetical protein
MEMKTRMSHMGRLEMENHKWQKRFVDLAQGIDRMESEFGAFEELELNPENRMIVQKKERRMKADAMVDSHSGSPSGDSLVENSRNLILSMHRALDDINHEASVLLNNRTALYNFVEKQNRLLAWVRPLLPENGTIKLPIQTPDFPPLGVGGSPEENHYSSEHDFFDIPSIGSQQSTKYEVPYSPAGVKGFEQPELNKETANKIVR